jgi:hypothetical protein
MITLRPATVADAAAISHIHVESWRTTYRGVVPDAFLDALSARGAGNSNSRRTRGSSSPKKTALQPGSSAAAQSVMHAKTTTQNSLPSTSCARPSAAE